MAKVLDSSDILPIIWASMDDDSRRHLRAVSRGSREVTYPFVKKLTVCFRSVVVPLRTYDLDKLDRRSAVRRTSQMPLSDTMICRAKNQTVLVVSVSGLTVVNVMPFLLRCVHTPLSSRVRSLRFQVDEVTQEHILAIRVAFPCMRELIVEPFASTGSVSIVGRAFDPLISSELQRLSLGLVDLSPQAVRSLGSLTSLRSLSLRSTRVIKMAHNPWTTLTSLTNLVRAKIEMEETSPRKLVFLHALTRLTYLTLTYIINDPEHKCTALMRSFCTMRHLRFLSVGDVDGRMIDALFHMPHLMTLQVTTFKCYLEAAPEWPGWTDGSTDSTAPSKLPFLEHIILDTEAPTILEVLLLLRALGPLPYLTYVGGNIYDQRGDALEGISMKGEDDGPWWREVPHIRELLRYPRLRLGGLAFEFGASGVLSLLTNFMRPIRDIVTGVVLQKWLGSPGDDPHALAACLPNVVTLHLERCTDMFDHLLTLVAHLPSLQRLVLDNVDMSCEYWIELSLAVVQRVGAFRRLAVHSVCKPPQAMVASCPGLVWIDRSVTARCIPLVDVTRWAHEGEGEQE